MHSPRGTSPYSDVYGCQTLLRCDTINVGCCSIMTHPDFGTKVRIATTSFDGVHTELSFCLDVRFIWVLSLLSWREGTEKSHTIISLCPFVRLSDRMSIFPWGNPYILRQVDQLTTAISVNLSLRAPVCNCFFTSLVCTQPFPSVFPWDHQCIIACLFMLLFCTQPFPSVFPDSTYV